MSSDYFLWDGSPEMFTIPVIQLPFELNIYGLVAGLAGYYAWQYYLGSRDQKAQSGKRNRSDVRHGGKKQAIKEKKQQEDASVTGTPNPAQRSPLPGFLRESGLFLGFMLLGQLLFLPTATPVLSEIGPIQPRWYGLMFAFAFVGGYQIGIRSFKHAGLPLELGDKLFMYIIVATVLGARLGHVIFYDLDYYLRHPAEILAFWQGGLASHGAAIGVVFSLWLFSKTHPQTSFLWLTDRIALPFAIGGAYVRTGNFFNSEILGKPAEVPWAVIFARVDFIPRHPSMLYEALLCVALFVFLYWLYNKYTYDPPAGVLTAWFFLILFAGRFFIEFTKENQSAFEDALLFNMGQLLSIPFVIAAGWWLIKGKAIRKGTL